jgi:hypothetical protein
MTHISGPIAWFIISSFHEACQSLNYVQLPISLLDDVTQMSFFFQQSSEMSGQLRKIELWSGTPNEIKNKNVLINLGTI